MATSYCYIDEAEEEITAESTVCFECGHVFRSDEEILKQYEQSFKELPHYKPKQNADEVFFCPLCLHDW